MQLNTIGVKGTLLWD